MASLLNADLPSEDEMDEDFDPDAEDAQKPCKKAKAAPAGVSRRGLAGAGQPSKPVDALDGVSKAAEAKRRAKAASLLASLKSTSDGRQAHAAKTAVAPLEATVVARMAPVIAPKPQKRPLHDPDAYWMQALGLAPPPKKLQASPALVSRILQSAIEGPPPSTTSPQPPPPTSHLPLPGSNPAANSSAAPASGVASGCATEHPNGAGEMAALATDAARAPHTAQATAAAAPAPSADSLDVDPAAAAAAAASAAAALRALESGQHHADAAKRGDMVRVIEKRNFAGQQVEMETEVHAGTKAAQQAQDRAAAASNRSGLDAALANMSGPRKANLIDKSADDWKGFKDSNSEVKDELNLYGKSSDKYLEKQAFLKKAELTEYEKQRDSRLQADMRTRGRL